MHHRVIIAGGGLAGLTAALLLNRYSIPVLLIEKKTYPFHRVCGEYISNEVLPFLNELGVSPEPLGPSHITQFQLSDTRGRLSNLPLDLGGFGISRFALDHFLSQQARMRGVSIIEGTSIDEVSWDGNVHHVVTDKGRYTCDVILGTHGKRSRIDAGLKRPFFSDRSPWAGIKYHVRLPSFPDNLIQLHNFVGGYCGVSRVENGIATICYLAHRDLLRTHGTVDAVEEQVLFRNPILKEILTTADFVFDKPETINEISFRTKEPVIDHVLMAGDAAGMIAPLSGNGMSMAIRSGILLSYYVVQYTQGRLSRKQMEAGYASEWHKQFAGRLSVGRLLQQLFGKGSASHQAVLLIRHAAPVARWLMKQTHGAPFGLPDLHSTRPPFSV